MHQDALIRGFVADVNLRVNHVIVTNTARELERRHLSGPTAARVLGQAVAAAALLSSDLEKEHERISLQLQTDGPIGGCLVDASAAGKLRGYTDTKILHEFDGSDACDLAPVMGTHGRMTVIHSNSRGIVYQGQVRAVPPSLQHNLARYYNESLQLPTAVALHARAQDGYLAEASGLVAERMPDGDVEAFVTVLERFQEGSVRRVLEQGGGLSDLGSLWGVRIEVMEVRPLQFGCTCSMEKIVDVVSALPLEDLREIVAEGEGQYVTCHFCGETYRIHHEGMKTLLHRKSLNG